MKANYLARIASQDPEGDDENVWIKWYKNSQLMLAWDSMVTIGAENIFSGDIITASIKTGDQYENGTWTNYSVLINDQTPPSMGSISIPSSAYIGVPFTVSCVSEDSGSSIAAPYPIVEVAYEDGSFDIKVGKKVSVRL